MDKINQILSKIDVSSSDFWFESLRVVVLIFLGWLLVRFLIRITKKVFSERFSPQWLMLSEKIIAYGGFTIIGVMVLSQLGFDLSTLLGAAGIFGIAIGFASQTSISNIISGVFLIWEKPFEINDIISMGSHIGVVVGIDMLSVKLKTFDNRYVRIPNENLIKTEIINISRYPIRRLDVEVGAAYKENPEKVMNLLKEIAAANEFALADPEPFILFKNFGASALEFVLGIWFEKNDYINLKNSIMKEIKEGFDKENIEIPFPHVTLYKGSDTEAFPVEIKNEV